MSLHYRRQADDLEYETIPLDCDYEEGKFGPFFNDDVYYSEKSVLVVIKKNGTRKVIYGGTPKKFCSERRKNEIWIDATIPLYRLWVRKKNMPLMQYKVPNVLPLDESGKWHRMSLSDIDLWRDMEFCADVYFESVYVIKRSE